MPTLMLHAQVRAAYPCPCYAASPCPCRISMSMPHFHVHGACPCSCRVFVFMPRVRVHAACPCPWRLSMAHVQVYAAFPCPWVYEVLRISNEFFAYPDPCENLIRIPDLGNCSRQNASGRDLINIFSVNKNDSLWHIEIICAFFR
jgi:hypothetical protein